MQNRKLVVRDGNLKFILISPKNRTTYNFRGDLLKEIISLGYEVIVTGPNEDGILKLYDESGTLYKTMLCDSGKCVTTWQKQ